MSSVSLLLLLLFSTFSILVAINCDNAQCTCSSGPCTIYCDDCKSTMTCYPGYSCIIDCTGDKGCRESTIIGNGATTIDIQCGSNSASCEATVYCTTSICTCKAGNCNGLNFLSYEPTKSPTIPTTFPTTEPTVITINSSVTPNIIPSIEPTVIPTHNTSKEPTIMPTHHPSFPPTLDPSHLPSISPTIQPTYFPSSHPTSFPSFQPTIPSIYPTIYPSIFPTNYPTMDPSTFMPTENPTGDAAELSNTGNKASLTTIIIIVVSLSIFFFIAFIIISYFYRKNKKHKEYKIRAEENMARMQNAITPNGNMPKIVHIMEVMDVNLQENENEKEIFDGKKSTEGEIEVHEIYPEEGNVVYQESNVLYCTPKC